MSESDIKILLKIDIKATSKVAKILDLQKSFAKILDVRPSTLQLVTIEDGCVMVTFLISAHMVDIVFPHGLMFTPEQIIQLQALSVKHVKFSNSKQVEIICTDIKVSNTADPVNEVRTISAPNFKIHYALPPPSKNLRQSNNKVTQCRVTLTALFQFCMKEEAEHMRYKEEQREGTAQSLTEQPPRPLGEADTSRKNKEHREEEIMQLAPVRRHRAQPVRVKWVQYYPDSANVVGDLVASVVSAYKDVLGNQTDSVRLLAYWTGDNFGVDAVSVFGAKVQVNRNIWYVTFKGKPSGFVQITHRSTIPFQLTL